MPVFTSEAKAFLLQEPRTGKLATVRPDGRPHIVPVWFDLDEDTLVFTTWHTSVKARNIRHEARVCLCVDDETPPFAYIQIEGLAQLIDNQEILSHWAKQIAGRYMGQELAETYGKRNSVPGELVVRVTPTKIHFEQNIAD